MINIIGAGHSGCFAAYLLARHGYKVSVWEKNKLIGFPQQCTGLVTTDINSIISIPKKLIHTTVNYARLHAPDGNFINVRLGNGNYVLKRPEFVQHLAGMAEKEGVKILLGKKFSHKIGSEYIIGADGPHSSVAGMYGFSTKRSFIHAPQVLAEFPNDNIIDLYTGIGAFAWAVPVTNDTSLLGLLAYKDALPLFSGFLHRLGIKNPHILERNGGIVPVFDPWLRTQKVFGRKKVFLLGDAACHVKATTAGGIIQSMIAAKCLADSIKNNKNYDIEWRKKLFIDLCLHLKVHHIFQKFSPADWSRLIELFSQQKLKSVLEKHNREHILGILLPLVLKEPRLLSFMKFLV